MKTLSFATSLLAFLIMALPAAAQHRGSDDQSKITKPDAILHVNGLSCAMCARNLTNKLKTLDAVDRVEVFLDKEQRALITLKAEKKVSEEDLRKTVEKAGFSMLEVDFLKPNPAVEDL